MTEQDSPQIYLITPAAFDPSPFAQELATILDAVPVACLRLALASQDEDLIARAADTLREVAHARDVALVIDRHVAMVERLGLDGVHLGDGARSVRKARATLGAEAIIGAFCGSSRHGGMNAGEAGADYVSFGPAGTTGLGDGSTAKPDLFAWWSEVIELPVVAEGALTPELVRSLAPVADFFALGDEIWREEDRVGALRSFAASLSNAG